MLFESESKANNFLKFNGEEILNETGKTPLRSYYCVFCCGWHLTSNPSKEVGEHIEEALKKKVEIISEINENNKLNRKRKKSEEKALEEIRIKNQITAKLEDFHVYLMTGRFDEAEDALVSCSLDIDDLQSLEITHANADKKIEKGRSLLRVYYDMQRASEDTRQKILKLTNPSSLQLQARSAIINLKVVEQVNEVVKNTDNLVYCEDDGIVKEILDGCKSKINTLNGKAPDKAKQYFISLLDNIEKERSIHLREQKGR